MYEYTVRCGVPDCEGEARYKVAARWSDGRFNELKTYGHACAEHAGEIFRAAEQRRALCPNVPGETVGETALYRSDDGWLSRRLTREESLEAQFRSWGSGNEGV